MCIRDRVHTLAITNAEGRVEAKNATINGIACLVLEGSKSESFPSPKGFPHRYAVRHGEGWGVPQTVEEGPVRVNFWGTLFSTNPFPTKDGFARIRSLSIEDGPEYPTMEGVCPDCGEGLQDGSATMNSALLKIRVSCPCGFTGTEEHVVSGILAEGSDDLSGLPEDDGALTDVPAAVSISTGKEAVSAPEYAVADHNPEVVTLEVPLADGTAATLVLLTRFDEIRKGEVE